MSRGREEEIAQLFHEDEVYHLDKKGNIVFGTVVRDCEMLNFDDSEDEDEDRMHLKEGEVLVSWYPKYEEKVHLNSSLKLGNRSLMPGDVVRRMDSLGKRSQTGYCREIKVRTSAAIKCSNDRVIYDINSEDLKPIQSFLTNSAVCLGPWVGVIRKVKLNVALAFHDDISRCVVDDNVISTFDDVNDKEQKITLFKRLDYYPGMILTGPLREFEGAEWFSCSDKLKELMSKKPMKFVKVTVLKTQVRELSVNWQCQACVGNESDGIAPDIIQGEDLKRTKILGYFFPCTLQIGDRFFYKIKEEDVILSKSKWLQREREILANEMDGESKPVDSIKLKEFDVKKEEAESKSLSVPNNSINKSNVSISVNKLRRRLKKRNKSVTAELYSNLPSCYSSVIPKIRPGEIVVVEALRTKAEVSVLWQDGSLEEGIDSSELYPIHHLDDKEFFTGEFVVRASDLGGLQSYGVVQHVDYQSRIAKIKWFHTYQIGSDPSPSYVGESEESVYDLRDHPDFNYRPGSVVIKVANFDNEESEGGLGGEVIEVYPNGKVTVWWANKKTTECWPQDLYKVGEYDSDEGELWDDDSDFEGEEKDEVEEDSWVMLTKLVGSGESEKTSESIVSEKCPRVIVFGLFEKIRTSLQKLEENFSEASKPQTSAMLEKLWEIYKDCCVLEKSIGTSYFALEKFANIIDRTSGKLNKVAGNKLAVQDQISRLFNSTSEFQNINAKENSLPSNDEQDIFYENTCRRICSLFKLKLAYVYDVIVEKYGTMVPQLSILEEIQHDKDLDILLSITGLTYDDISPVLPKEEGEHKIEAPQVEKAVVSPPEEVLSPVELQSLPLEAVLNFKNGTFKIEESAPQEHTFKVSLFEPVDPKNFLKFVKKEAKLLSSSLPSGIVLKGYEDRIDLFSAMIKGPSDTPYHDGVFFFDFQLPPDYPKSPPTCFYISFCSDRLNPNLYEEGKVCVSLLGTWSGKGTEIWTPNSNLLQLLLSIQGLILVKEPYFNEAGYESQKFTKHGEENSWMYNEMVVIKIVQSMTRLLISPPPIFKDEILEHINERGDKFVKRWREWLEISSSYHSSNVEDKKEISPLDFPLLPASKGFCVSFAKSLDEFDLAHSKYLASNS
nr:LOW QUALITY PROTEIN: (E3-independent) E2 ubiquitin-conjugating enzyme UBE2O-like [Lepeophtheirus salmonis]